MRLGSSLPPLPMPLGQMASMGVEIRALAEMRLVKLRVDVLCLHHDAQDDRRQRRRKAPITVIEILRHLAQCCGKLVAVWLDAPLPLAGALKRSGRLRVIRAPRPEFELDEGLCRGPHVWIIRRAHTLVVA